MLKTILITAALAAIPSAAFAELTIGHPVSVRTNDLDLASEVGRAQLFYRLNQAVDSVCGKVDVASAVDPAALITCRRIVAKSVRQRSFDVIASRSRGAALAQR